MINIRHILDNSADILTDKAQLKWFKVRIAGKAQGGSSVAAMAKIFNAEAGILGSR